MDVIDQEFTEALGLALPCMVDGGSVVPPMDGPDRGSGSALLASVPIVRGVNVPTGDG